MKRRTVHVVASLILACADVAVADPLLSFESDRVVAEGVSPGGEVLWFGLVRSYEGRAKELRRVDHLVTDDDGDGRVELMLQEVLPDVSSLFAVWAVVDLQTTTCAFDASPGTPLREIAIAVEDLVMEQGGVIGVVQGGRSFLELLLVQPGSGSWGLSVGDGGASDGDGAANGEIRVDLSSMYALHGSSAAPEAAMPGGVLLVIDPRSLEIGAIRLTSQEQAAGLAAAGAGV